ncbi:hypothetical protein ABMA27_002909 [Loxostege sticticalis]|uniref:Major facilitator superfamily (MFS) profile domain-containing protein n=1 Tax=Loxostege sticticalis TaxID=481309 RepID=A0ABR3HVB8_LOXSC
MANTDGEKVDASKFLRKDSAPDTLNFDQILQEEVGQFGWFQVRNIILAMTAVIFLVWGNNSYVFTAARIPTRCLVPECDLEVPEFTPEWLLNAVPGTSLDSFDNCKRFGNASAATLEKGSCPAAWFDQDKLQNCERHLYQNTDTIVYDFDLACNEWLRTIVGSIRLSATIFSQIITGLISDRWGRRTALVFNAFNAAWIGILRSFSNGYIIFVIGEFVSSTLGSATFQSSHILAMELVSPKNRVFVGACLNTCASLGLMSLGLIAWAVPYWRHLSLALYTPQLLTISYLWLMNESVRWYISKGRYEDTERVLKNIAKANKKHISDKSLEVLRKKTEEVKRHQEESQEREPRQKEPSMIKLLFQYKPILCRCIITPLLWITHTLVFHGLTINAVDISRSKYVNYIAVAVAQIPGYWISLLLLDKIGRKPVLIASYWICAICQIVFIFLPKNQYVASLTVYMVGACSSGGVLSSLYIYTAELYPTSHRHRLFAFSCMVGRFGGILAPLTPALGALVWEQFPFALFAGCACAAGALVLLTPETRGVRLPDTMREAADLGKKNNYTSPT